MVFCPNSRESCDYYNVDFDTKRKLTDQEIERKNYEENHRVEKNSLIGRPQSGSYDYHPSQSRDYALSHTIPCGCIVCPANKNLFCEVPSLIKINAKGVCTTGLAFVEQEKKPRDPETIGKW